MRHLAGITAIVGFAAVYEQSVNGGAEWLHYIAGGALLVCGAIAAVWMAKHMTTGGHYGDVREDNGDGASPHRLRRVLRSDAGAAERGAYVSDALRRVH